MIADLEAIRMDVMDVVTEAYGYKQLVEVHEASGYNPLDEDIIAEICYDLGVRNSVNEQNLLTIGFLLGVAHAVEVIEEEE